MALTALVSYFVRCHGVASVGSVMNQCHSTRCGAWQSSTAQSVAITSGEGPDPSPPSALSQPSPPSAQSQPSPLLLSPVPGYPLSPSQPCWPPGAGHRWGPHHPATGAASLCIPPGSCLLAGTVTWIVAAHTPTPAQPQIATIGEVRPWPAPYILHPLHINPPPWAAPSSHGISSSFVVSSLLGPYRHYL